MQRPRMDAGAKKRVSGLIGEPKSVEQASFFLKGRSPL